MAVATFPLAKASVLNYGNWGSRLPEMSRTYKQNQPYLHILIPNFLLPEVALTAAGEFPGPRTEAWTQYKHQNENKLGLAKRDFFPPNLGSIVDELNSPGFVSWLSHLTGIPGLMADPGMEGGGLHQSTRGGFLNIHTDFSFHHYNKHWRRRVNLIVYLNPGWDPEWGGAIELWKTDMKACVAKYPPLLNHAFIFDTNEKSLHGFADPLQCPEGESRKSVALYYYTVETDPHARAKSTNYRARPTDGLWTSTMIWLDKTAVDLYSRAKTRFGFSDEFASRMLGLFSRKK